MRLIVLHDGNLDRGWLAPRLLGCDDLVVVDDLRVGDGSTRTVAAQSPDVVALDLHGPTPTSLSLIRALVRDLRAHVVVVQSGPGDGKEFLAAGALAALSRPPAGTDPERWLDAFRRSARAAANIPPLRPRRPPLPARDVGDPSCELVGIGASTGGPASLNRIFALLAPPPCPVLVVTHTTRSSIDGLVAWLRREARLPLAIAEDGAPLDSLRGHAIFAPHDRHLVVRGECIELRADAPCHHVRPAVDVLFESLARWRGRVLGVLLTGMGRDGATGLRAIREAGGRTLVQDRESSVVFGMPAAAIAAEAAEQVLPDTRIGQEITRLCDPAASTASTAG